MHRRGRKINLGSVMMQRESIIPVESLENKILLLRGFKVILDSDLAELYRVTTKRLNEQVKRNLERFPDDFTFQLTVEEKNEVVAICDHLKKLKYSPALPRAFTEHGAIMAASVLNSRRAVEASIFIVRAFVRLRKLVVAQDELARKLTQLERVVGSHESRITEIIEAIRMLTMPEDRLRRRIGFKTGENPQ
jgi:hypothetical protein